MLGRFSLPHTLFSAKRPRLTFGLFRSKDEPRVKLSSSTILTLSLSSNLYMDKLNCPMMSMASNRNDPMTDKTSDGLVNWPSKWMNGRSGSRTLGKLSVLTCGKTLVLFKLFQKLNIPKIGFFMNLRSKHTGTVTLT